MPKHFQSTYKFNQERYSTLRGGSSFSSSIHSISTNNFLSRRIWWLFEYFCWIRVQYNWSTITLLNWIGPFQRTAAQQTDSIYLQWQLHFWSFLWILFYEIQWRLAKLLVHMMLCRSKITPRLSCYRNWKMRSMLCYPYHPLLLPWWLLFIQIQTNSYQLTFIKSNGLRNKRKFQMQDRSNHLHNHMKLRKCTVNL